jgi:molecular chaperone GrpE
MPDEEIKKEDKLPDSELEKTKKERDEYLAGWQRAKADFLNYQKNEKTRLEEFLKFCEAGLIGDLLPVLDSFDLALAQIGETSDPKFKGFFLIKSQMEEILKKRGLEPIKSLGEKFNPELHEAVASVDDKIKESQTIVEETQKGYALNGRTLRAAKVKIIK